MSIHVCTCNHNNREEFHLRYPGMSKAAAQELADKINAGYLSRKGSLSKEELSVLVDRFLIWKLPSSVCPDPAIRDVASMNLTGTNLLSADEARQMLMHVLGIVNGD